MIENISGIVTIASTVLFTYTLIIWLKMAKRANKVIDEFEKMNSDDSPKCDYSPGKNWLDEHID